jgi:hypothetical protein
VDLDVVAQLPEPIVNVGLHGLRLFPNVLVFDERGFSTRDEVEPIWKADVALDVELEADHPKLVQDLLCRIDLDEGLGVHQMISLQVL